MSQQSAAAAPYTPTPGSVAFRAIAWLETQAPGLELMTSRLAESIGVAPAILPASLEAALKHRAIFARKKIDALRAPLFWSLVDHASVAPTARVEQPPVALVPVQREASVTLERRPREQKVARALRIALWSDKRLQIGETLYTVEETRAIVDYLDSIALEVGS